jgi:VWFA-related protein
MHRGSRCRLLTAALAWAALLGLVAGVGLRPAQAAPPQEPAQDEPLQTLTVDVNVVSLYFTVKERRGALVPDLTKDDFEIFEDGQKQEIRYFSAHSDQPLTMGILIDTSGSMQRILPVAQDVGAAFLQSIMRPKDLGFVISFDVNVDLLQDFTPAPGELRAALRRATINSGIGGGMPGLGGGPVPISRPRGTLLYDAVYLASQEKLASEVGRKTLILLTDGDDVGSRMNLRQAIEAAQKADAMCYVLLVTDGYSGESEMRRLTAETGGRVIKVGNRPERLREAFEQIAAELRSQYNIGYTPTNRARDGSFRRIEIKTRRGHRVQGRNGYYAPAN